MKQACRNCSMWSALTDREMRPGRGECTLPMERESVIVSFVKFRMKGDDQHDPVRVLTEEESTRLGVERFYPGFVTEGDFYCAAFDERELTDEEIIDREGEEWKDA